MTTARGTARLAGALYLVCGITGFFNIMYIPSAFVVPGDAAATAHKIADATLIYRLGILSGLVSEVVFILLAVTLYELLKGIDRRQAMLLVILVSVSAAIGVVNLIIQTAPLVLLSGAGYLSAFTTPQLNALVLGLLRLRTNGFMLQSAFWGLWLLPFGLLVMRSGFIPKFLGVMLIVACFAYLAGCVAGLVSPTHAHAITQLTLPLAGIAELAMTAWLLVKGTREPATGRLPRTG